MSDENQINILCVDDDPDVLDLYILMIESEFENVNIKLTASCEEAMAALAEEVEYDVVLSDYHLPEKNGGDLYHFMFMQMMEVPFILISNSGPTEDDRFKDFLNSPVRNAYIQKPGSKDDIIAKLRWVFGSELDIEFPEDEAPPEGLGLFDGEKNVSKKKLEEPTVMEGWAAIPIRTFLKCSKTPCDVYIKLNEKKYLKLIHANELYTLEIIEKYIDKQVDWLFVHKEHHVAIADEITAKLLTILDAKKTASLQEQEEAIDNVMDSVRDNISKFGVSKKTTEVVDQCVKTSMAILEKTPGLADLLARVSDFEGYANDHSKLINYIAVQVATKMSLASEATVTKLTLASMLHDSTLPEELVKFSKLSELDDENIDEKLKEKFKAHPQEAANIIKEFDSIPPDVDNIIVQHHEEPDGSGFPKSLSAMRISPLSAIFSLSERFVEKVYDFEFDDTIILNAIEEMEPVYNKGNFKKPFEALKAVICK